MLEIIELEISNHHKQGLWRRSRAFHTLKVKLAPLTLTLTASLISWRLEMRAKNFVVNRGISCVNRGISCVNRGVSCFIRGVSCFIRCILSCFIRCNPVFQSWSSRRERVNFHSWTTTMIKILPQSYKQRSALFIKSDTWITPAAAPSGLY